MKKKITFIYSSSAEKSMYLSMLEEAQKRGYKTRLSSNPFEKCEIGVYCQHVNFPQYSKYSVIMLHDIMQHYDRWPDIWFFEPWHKYDIGVLPSTQWSENWYGVSKYFYTNPKKGMFKVGWPKADTIASKKKSAKLLLDKYNIDKNKPVVLYAPSWECDLKQDEFVKAMKKLDVNILIKQPKLNESDFPEIVKNIKKMEELHTNLKNVTILPTKTNIFEAISISDILVSDESSTMGEALMMGIPAVSVSDWLIPDTTPSRYPKCDYENVIKTTKLQLTDCVKSILENYNSYTEKANKYSSLNFSNIGKTSKIIIDIIDDLINQKEFRHKSLEPQTKKNLSLQQCLKFHYYNFIREIEYNYSTRFSLVGRLWCALRRIKRDIFNK